MAAVNHSAADTNATARSTNTLTFKLWRRCTQLQVKITNTHLMIGWTTIIQNIDKWEKKCSWKTRINHMTQVQGHRLMSQDNFLWTWQIDKYHYVYGELHHNILQPELILSCHKKVTWSDILRDLLTLTHSQKGLQESSLWHHFLFSFFFLNVGCTTLLWFGRHMFFKY